MRPSTAFFAGIGTVFGALAIGFAGALVVTGVNDPAPRPDSTKLERRTIGAAPVQSAAPEARAAETQSAAASNPSGSQTVATSEAAQPSPQFNQTPPTAPTLQPPVQQPNEPQPAAQAPATGTSYYRADDEEFRRLARKHGRRWARRHGLPEQQLGADAQRAEQQIAAQDNKQAAAADGSSSNDNKISQQATQPASQQQLSGRPSQQSGAEQQTRGDDRRLDNANGRLTDAEVQLVRRYGKRWARRQGIPVDSPQQSPGQVQRVERIDRDNLVERGSGLPPAFVLRQPRQRSLFDDDDD